jgi:hypothetical protein
MSDDMEALREKFRLLAHRSEVDYSGPFASGMRYVLKELAPFVKAEEDQ